MKIKRIEIKGFKCFTHLVVESIPDTAKLVVLVGPNGSGKTSFFEALNHYNKLFGYSNYGDEKYLKKKGVKGFESENWYEIVGKLVEIECYDKKLVSSPGSAENKGSFYFRSAYRNEPGFQVTTMQRQANPTDSANIDFLIQNEHTVSSNYQRLVVDTITGVFKDENSELSVKELRDELFGKISTAVEHVFEDLKLTSIGEPLNDGNFYFTKGISENFSYTNLSAGEKSAFDLLLDLIIKSGYYTDAVYCIDEPEAHMHTMLQGKVLRELYQLVPDNSQLWIATHSIGMLREAEDIENACPGTVAFLDFGGRDFDEDQMIQPSRLNSALNDKFYELVLGDFATMILPEKIVFCEGTPGQSRRSNFDKEVYSTIFSDMSSKVHFISGGSCNDIIEMDEKLGHLFNEIFKDVEIIKVIDLDDRTTEEIKDLNQAGIRVLSKRNLESYLLDDSVIYKLHKKYKQVEKYETSIEAKQKALEASIGRNNAPDDLKSARGDIYNHLKRELKMTQCGNDVDAFLKYTMAPLITPDMDIYQQLKKDIFGNN